jgi:dephospho-CoA kinase
MRYSDNEYVEVEVEVHAVTQKAMLLSKPDYDESSASWVPKSQMNQHEKLDRGDVATVNMAEWIAKREGFI